MPVQTANFIRGQGVPWKSEQGKRVKQFCSSSSAGAPLWRFILSLEEVENSSMEGTPMYKYTFANVGDLQIVLNHWSPPLVQMFKKKNCLYERLMWAQVERN